MPTWKLIDTGSNSGAFNMAFDEELLARAQAGEITPVLRFYSWSPPAVSIGRFQDMRSAVSAEACRDLEFDIVRRVTGGRAVLHKKELTYSVVARSDDPLFPPDVLGTYRTIALGLVAGLRSLGLPAQIVSRSSTHAQLVEKKAKAAACFASPSWYEILVDSRKIAGSAQRRLSNAFLQHGSILMEYDPVLEARVIPGETTGERVTCINREIAREVTIHELKEAVLRGFAGALNVQFTVDAPSAVQNR